MHGKGCMCGKRGMYAGDTATKVGGTHPTGMHSCLILHFFYQLGADSVQKMEGIIPFRRGVKTREYKIVIKS